jgi:hypothetical protein
MRNKLLCEQKNKKTILTIQVLQWFYDIKIE